MPMSAAPVPDAVNEKRKEPVPKTNKDKLYSGVVFEEADDEKENKHRNKARDQRYVGDHIRDLNKYSPRTKKQVSPETARSSSLSTAFEYILSPVKYIASAFTSATIEPETSKQKPSPKLVIKTKSENSPVRMETSRNRLEIPPKGLESSMEVVKTPLNGAQAFSRKDSPLRPQITQSETSPRPQHQTSKIVYKTGVKNKKPPQKSTNIKKSPETKKRQSPTLKKSQKIALSPIPQLHQVDSTRSAQSLSPNRPSSSFKITKSNQMSYRVTTTVDSRTESVNDVNEIYKLLHLEANPTIASRSNNSNKCLSPQLLSGGEEQSFPYISLRRFSTYGIHECSNLISEDRHYKAATGNVSPAPPNFGQFRHKPREPSLTIQAATSTLDDRVVNENSSHEREFIYSTYQPTLYNYTDPEASIDSISKSFSFPQSSEPDAEQLVMEPTILLMPRSKEKPISKIDSDKSTQKNSYKFSKIDSDKSSKLDSDKSLKYDSEKLSKKDSDRSSKTDLDKFSKIDSEISMNIDSNKNSKIDSDQSSKIDSEKPFKTDLEKSMTTDSEISSKTDSESSPKTTSAISKSRKDFEKRTPAPATHLSPDKVIIIRAPNFIPPKKQSPKASSRSSSKLQSRGNTKKATATGSKSKDVQSKSKNSKSSKESPIRPTTARVNSFVVHSPQYLSQMPFGPYVFDGEVYRKANKLKAVEPKSPPTTTPKVTQSTASLAASAAAAVATKAATVAINAVGRIASNEMLQKKVPSPSIESIPSTQDQESWFLLALRSFSPIRNDASNEVSEIQSPLPTEVTPLKKDSMTKLSAPTINKQDESNFTGVKKTRITTSAAVNKQIPPISTDDKKSKSPSGTSLNKHIPLIFADERRSKNAPGYVFNKQVARSPTKETINKTDEDEEASNSPEVEQEKIDDYPKSFSPSATFLGEFP